MNRNGTPKNLKVPEKGQPGIGRPKGSISVGMQIEKFLNKEIKIANPFSDKTVKQNKTVFDAMCAAVAAKVLATGDVAGFKEFMDRVAGKAVTKIEGDINVKDMTNEELEDATAQ